MSGMMASILYSLARSSITRSRLEASFRASRNLASKVIPGNATSLTTYTITPGDGVDDWTTLPMFYSYLPVLSALQSHNGSRVVDLNLENSMNKANSTNAAYGIYDATTSEWTGWRSSV